MRADNTPHLRGAARARHDATRRRALTALEALETSQTTVTVAGLAKAAGIARSWIYTQHDILERIRTTRPDTPDAQPRRTQASGESWQRRLDLAHQRIKELTTENTQLRHQLALAHGQRRADLTTASRTPSTTQSP